MQNTMPHEVSSITQILGPSKAGRHSCPICGTERRVAADTGRDGKPTFYCHHTKGRCDVWGYVKSRLNGATLNIRPNRYEGISQRQEEADRHHRAYVILRAATLANAGRPDAYLRARGITIDAGSSMLLPAQRQRQGVRRAPSRGRSMRSSRATSWLVLDTTTFDAIDGTERIKGHKRSWGAITGGYVPLGTIKDDAPLIVAEGIETALSAMQIAGIAGGISTCGTSGMSSVMVPPCSEVIIAADPGGRWAASSQAIGAAPCRARSARSHRNAETRQRLEPSSANGEG